MDSKPKLDELDELMDNCGTEYKAIGEKKQYARRGVSERPPEFFFCSSVLSVLEII